MYIGINIGHDAGVAITDSSGVVQCAIAEERISRTKIHSGLPIESLKLLGSFYDLSKIENVVIGNNQTLETELLRRTLADLDSSRYRKRGMNQPVTPGLRISNNSKEVQLDFFSRLSRLIGDNKKYLLPRHHDSHLGCAIGVANYGQSALLLSLDGKGDGESGAVSSLRSNGAKMSQSYTEHARFPTLDSFGLLYNAVTRAYNFKPIYHDGKITGLAAYGNYSEAVAVLLQYVSIKDGIPTIIQVRNLKDRFLKKGLNQIGLGKFSKKSLEEIIQIAEAKTVNYPDLAFAIQEVLEKSVIEIVSYWQNKLSCNTLALAGGVFANVKLNQKLSELEIFDDLRIFPNMGDGGIALGGIWFELYKKGELSKNDLFEDMFLAPDMTSQEDVIFEKLKKTNSLVFEQIQDQNLPKLVASLLFSGQVGAIHKGKMEFGPRALCNRSILADPRDSSINKSINERLGRTEFMPFAPVVKIENFKKYFEISPNQSLFPFKYMTMTCNVKKDFAHFFPAVVHVDGTARPQIVERSDDEIMWKILDEFEKLSGVGILVNTSFNVHEEPINFRVEDSIEALKRNAVDFLIYGDYLIKLKNY
jgi:carbamoyltransferase